MSGEFVVKVGVHQGSVLSPLLFNMVLKDLSKEFHASIPWEDLYADDLVINAESLAECLRRLLVWQEVMEQKNLHVNIGKTQIMVFRTGLDKLESSGRFPCGVCRTAVGNSSIFFEDCKHWTHKKCSNLKRLKPDPNFGCVRCLRTACPIGGRPQEMVVVGTAKFEVVVHFCYLGDMQSAAGGCELVCRLSGRSSRNCCRS